MSYPLKSRTMLREAIIGRGLSVPQAAKEVGVAYSTAKRWIEEAATSGEDWLNVQQRLGSITRTELEASLSNLLSTALAAYQQVLDQVQRDVTMPPLEKAAVLAGLIAKLAGIRQGSGRKR